MKDLERIKAIALRNLSYEYPRKNQSKHGNDWMNGCWQGLMNFCLETGIVTKAEVDEAKRKRNE